MARFFAMTPRCSAFAVATLTPYGLVAGEPRRRRGIVSLAAPAGGLLASKRARLAVVAAAPGPGDHPSDRGAIVSCFCMEMELFKLPPRPMQFHGPPELLEVAVKTAWNSIRLFECLLANKNVDPSAYKELVLGGKALVIVEVQCADGYVRSDALIRAAQSLKLAGQSFFPCANLVEYTVAPAPVSGDDVDKEAYLNHLVQALVVYYGAVGLEAHDAYGFSFSFN